MKHVWRVTQSKDLPAKALNPEDLAKYARESIEIFGSLIGTLQSLLDLREHKTAILS